MGRISKNAKQKVLRELECLKYYPAKRNYKDVADSIENIIIESYCRENHIEEKSTNKQSD